MSRSEKICYTSSSLQADDARQDQLVPNQTKVSSTILHRFWSFLDKIDSIEQCKFTPSFFILDSLSSFSFKEKNNKLIQIDL